MSYNKENPYELPLLPPKIDFENPKFKTSLLEARVALAELKGRSDSIPNPLLLLSPAILRESVASSEIEGIHTTIIDVLQNQLFPEKEQRETDKEVLRYHDAILWGYEHLKEFPMASRLILGIQKRLIPAHHGEYRKLPNRIVNDKTKETIYTPPIASDVPRLMSNWENYINNEDRIDPLIKVSVAHYQFEAIHPFGDGNGRTGRMLMVLYLIKKDILIWPILYISGYINKYRSEYYDLLGKITEKGEWDDFILFMLKGFQSQATATKDLLLKMLSLFDRIREQVKKEHKKLYSADLIEALFSYPIINPVKLAETMGIHYVTASKYLSRLAKAGILGEGKYGKYHLFINKELIKLIQGK
jgi:Fic family protein